MLNVDPQKPESTALRAFAVLEYVAHANTPVSLDDVTHACKLPKPTVFRILSMLFEADLVYREPLGKRYTVGARSAALALDVLRHSTLRSQPHTVLQELVDAVGETFNVTILDGNQVLYLDRVETPMPLRLHLEPGTRVPLHLRGAASAIADAMAPLNKQASHVTQSDSAALL